MQHKATIRFDTNHPYKPFFAGCSCGPQGNFEKKDEAEAFLIKHLNRFSSSVVTKEYVDETLQVVPDKAEEGKAESV